MITLEKEKVIEKEFNMSRLNYKEYLKEKPKEIPKYNYNNLFKENSYEQKEIIKPIETPERLIKIPEYKLRYSYHETTDVNKPYYFSEIPEKPKMPNIFLMFKKRLPSENIKKSKGRARAFDVYMRRFGKFYAIGKGLPYGRAILRGEERTRKTLGATFRLKESGITSLKDISKGIDTRIFRKPLLKSKLNKPLTFIQRGKFRLSARSERAEIQRARKINIRRFI